MGGASQIRILLVDDHPIVRGGLIRLIEQQKDLVCCGEASTVAEAQEAVAGTKPHLIILELRLRGGDGLQLIQKLVSQPGNARILVFSQYDAPLYAERALRAGALGFAVKEQTPEEVLNAIRTVLRGEVYLARPMAALLLHKFVGGVARPSRGTAEQLTNRELHVLSLLGGGLSTRQIAEELKLSFKTVETHRENIKRKVGLESAAALVHYATQWAHQEHGGAKPDKAMLSAAKT